MAEVLCCCARRRSLFYGQNAHEAARMPTTRLSITPPQILQLADEKHTGLLGLDANINLGTENSLARRVQG